MQIGVVFPQTEIAADPGAIKAFAQGVEQLGYDYLMTSDHVLGADPETHPSWKGTWSNRHQFLEPLTTLAFVAANTERIGLTTGIMLLPLRQSALVAKQAAMVDILSRGRLRLGFGLGREETLVEYEGLGQEFHTRGRRIEEQITVLRLLWTKQTVSFKGRWHTITEAGINPMPVQRPIPMWLGGAADAVHERVGRMGDGWLTTRLTPTDAELHRGLERIRASAKAAGRDSAAIGLDGRVRLQSSTIEACAKMVAGWREIGATHATLNTWEAGFQGPDQHIKTLERLKAAIG